MLLGPQSQTRQQQVGQHPQQAVEPVRCRDPAVTQAPAQTLALHVAEELLDVEAPGVQVAQVPLASAQVRHQVPRLTECHLAMGRVLRVLHGQTLIIVLNLVGVGSD